MLVNRIDRQDVDYAIIIKLFVIFKKFTYYRQIIDSVFLTLQTVGGKMELSHYLKKSEKFYFPKVSGCSTSRGERNLLPISLKKLRGFNGNGSKS